MLFVLVLVNVSFSLYLILLHSSSFTVNIHAVIICALPRFIDSPFLSLGAVLFCVPQNRHLASPTFLLFAVASSLYLQFKYGGVYWFGVFAVGF